MAGGKISVVEVHSGPFGKRSYPNIYGQITQYEMDASSIDPQPNRPPHCRIFVNSKHRLLPFFSGSGDEQIWVESDWDLPAAHFVLYVSLLAFVTNPLG